MAAFAVEVPSGGSAFTGLEPTEWAGYPVNTILTVLPSPYINQHDATELEIVASGIDTEDYAPQLFNGTEDVAMTINSFTPNSWRVPTPANGIGVWRGTIYSVIPPIPDLVDFTIDGAANEFTDQIIADKGWIWGGSLPPANAPDGSYSDMQYNGSSSTTCYFDVYTADGQFSLGQTITYRFYFTTNNFRHRIRLDQHTTGAELGFDSTTGANNPLTITRVVQQADLDNDGYRFYTYSGSGGSPGTGIVRCTKIEILLT